MASLHHRIYSSGSKVVLCYADEREDLRTIHYLLMERKMLYDSVLDRNRHILWQDDCYVDLQSTPSSSSSHTERKGERITDSRGSVTEVLPLNLFFESLCHKQTLCVFLKNKFIGSATDLELCCHPGLSPCFKTGVVHRYCIFWRASN